VCFARSCSCLLLHASFPGAERRAREAERERREAERERLQLDAEWESKPEVRKYKSYDEGSFDISYLVDRAEGWEVVQRYRTVQAPLTESDKDLATALENWECKICCNGINIGAEHELPAQDTGFASNEKELKELVSAHAGHQVHAEGDQGIVLHVFHKRCLETHAKKSHEQHRAHSCPSCRLDLDREPLPAAVRRSQQIGKITFQMRIGDNPYFISQCISCSPLNPYSGTECFRVH